MYICRSRSHAYDKKEQVDLQNQSVRNQKEFIHQLFGLSNEEEKQFNQFLATDDFIEILAIIWRYGSKRKGHFSIRNKKKEIPERVRELVASLKLIQTDRKIPQAKQIYYQSQKEIPLILEFAGAIKSLHRFDDFCLGYICTNERKRV